VKHPPATPASFISGIPKIFHNPCGGRVWRNSYQGFWECGGCGHVWQQETIAKFSEAECEVRFHLRGDIDPNDYAIVWDTDGKTYFTRLVPVSEAHKYERLKL
jgi:hypothetical protein